MKLVLVTGCPRSGTTAVASWLSQAPGITGVSETRRTVAVHAMLQEARRFEVFVGRQLGNATSELALRESARAALDRLYGSVKGVVIDKEPLEPVAFPRGDYAEFLDNVRGVFGAKLMCMVRNPADTVASMVRRLWGYSLAGGTPRALMVENAVAIWQRAARAVLRSVIIDPDHARLQSYERLCELPGVESSDLRTFTGISPEDAFKPRLRSLTPLPTAHQVRTLTTWERRLLGYDERPAGCGAVVLLTGEPGAGKTTLAAAVEGATAGRRVTVLDGDALRERLWPELGYDAFSRAVAVDRATRLAIRVAAAGAIVVVAMVAPSEAVRLGAADMVEGAGLPFAVVHVDASAEIRAQRRPPRPGFVPTNYERPATPDLRLLDRSLEASVQLVLELIHRLTR